MCYLALGVSLGSSTALAAATEPSIIIGVNDGSGWGPADSAKFHEFGFTSERLEAGGPYTTIAESTALGWTDDTVIVGNTDDEEPLRSVNIPEWTANTLAQVKEEASYGVTLLEVGNEMYLKGYCEDCYQQKEPAKYAEMFVSLSKAVEAAGIKGVKLLFDSFGNYEETEGGKLSQISHGGGWLATAEKAEPELLKRVAGFTMHPYGEAGENKENDWGPGALKAEHEQAVSLGFENTEYYVTEFGVQLDVGGVTGSTSLANQAEKIKAVYNELIGDGFVKGIWYYQTHDDGTGKWGLIEHQESGSSPFVPRPALEVVSHFALTYDGPNTPAPLVLPNGEQEVFYRGTNGEFYYWLWNDTTWSLKSLGSMGSLASNPVPVLESNGDQYVYYRGTNGELYYWLWNGTTWSLKSLGATEAVAGNPAPVLEPNGDQYVYYRGTNGELYFWLWNGTTWSLNWLGATEAVAGNPAPVLEPNGDQYVYYRGTNGKLYFWLWNDTTWSLNWLGSTEAISGDPAIAFYPSNGDQYVYYRGTNGELYFWLWNGTTWSLNWLGATEAVAGNPAPVLEPNGDQYVYYRGTNGKLYFWLWNDTTWSLNWLGSTEAMGGDPGVVLYPSGGDQYVYYGGVNGQLYFWLWNDTTWDLNWLGSAGVL
jgi:hypothetical protein